MGLNFVDFFLEYSKGNVYIHNFEVVREPKHFKHHPEQGNSCLDDTMTADELQRDEPSLLGQKQCCVDLYNTWVSVHYLWKPTLYIFVASCWGSEWILFRRHSLQVAMHVWGTSFIRKICVCENVHVVPAFDIISSCWPEWPSLPFNVGRDTTETQRDGCGTIVCLHT